MSKPTPCINCGKAAYGRRCRSCHLMKITKAICKLCGKRTSKSTTEYCVTCWRNTPSLRAQREPRYCARPGCTNLITRGGTAPRFCSTACSYQAHKTTTIWSDAELVYLREHYPTDGADLVAAAVNKTHDQVMRKANSLKIGLHRGTRCQIAGDVNRERMTTRNPMHDPTTAQKVAEWNRTTEAGRVNFARLTEASQRIQRDQPSGLEKRLRQILNDLAVIFEPSFLIKPYFIVDIRIGDLIIQADGEYWHGHPRFEPLTERQQKQQRRDKAQDAYLHKCGYTVVRIWDRDVTPDNVRRILQQHGILPVGD